MAPSSPTVLTIRAIRDEVDIILEASYEVEHNLRSQRDPNLVHLIEVQARREQLEDIHDLLVDAECEVRKS